MQKEMAKFRAFQSSPCSLLPKKEFVQQIQVHFFYRIVKKLMFQIAKQNRISPKYILISSSPEKPNPKNTKTYKSPNPLDKFQTLTEKSNLNKFHTAKSLMRKQSFKPMSKQIIRNVESIRSDLNECMNSIINQEEKNKIFKELIAVLQDEMQKIEENEKHVNEVQQEENLKKAHKVQYDVEQILQKSNEEVARIHNLKEQVASSRSDRVVFSNLFKKIEKEIKQNEEYYKSLIVKTEINREKLADRQLDQLELTHQLSIDQVQPKDEQFRFSDKNVAKPTTAVRAASRLFLTNPLLASTNIKKQSNKAERSSEQQQSLNLKFMIEQVETKLEKVIKTVECDSLQDALNVYDEVIRENEHLSQLVNEQDKKIQTIEAEMERIRQERRASQIYEKRHIGKLQSLPSTRKIRSIKHIKTAITEQSDRNDENLEIVLAICELFNLSKKRSISSITCNEQALTSIEHEIDHLSTSSKAYKKTDSNLSLSNSEHGLDQLLSKMERFESCDRILSKNQFYTEYTKEIGKNKRLKGKKTNFA